jgi:membrane peptidoglycan carboxypeptidase
VRTQSIITRGAGSRAPRSAGVTATERATAMVLVISLTAAIVAVGLLPAVAGIGKAISKFDNVLLGDSGSKVELPPFPQRSTIYAADGSVLATVADYNRAVIPLSEVPKTVRQAVLAIEDDGFYRHGPVDVFSILRAAAANLRAGEVVQGGSTITQQLVKQTEVGNEQTFARKFKEAQAAIQLERQHSKDQILEAYLNEVYFGHGAYGIKAAAEYYFAREPAQLTLPQSALLAGLISSPARWDPVQHSTEAVARRNQVLGRMFELRWISASDYRDATSAPIKLKKKGRTVNALGPEPYFVQFVKDQILHPDLVFSETDPRRAQYLATFGKTYDERARALFQGGLKIYTTLDPKIQKVAAKTVQTQLAHQGQGPPADPEAAVVTLVPQTGAIQVMYGGSDFSKEHYNLATQAHRTAGSSFKAFTLAAAFEKGKQPTQTYDASSPAHIPQDKCPNDKGDWMPSNAEPAEGGIMNMVTATALSVNAYFANLIADIGPGPVADAATRMGVVSYARGADVSISPYACAITLGAVQVNPLSMTSGYATLANNGVHCLPFAVRKVADSKGSSLLKAKPVCEQVIEKKIAAQVTSLLEGVLQFGTAAGKGIGRPAAGKTGTGQDYQDAWFLGYVPQLVTGVWVGYTKGLIPMRGLTVLGGRNAFGGSIAAPIWQAVMLEAVKGLPVKDFPSPPGPKAGNVPNVVGLTQDQAQKRLTDAGFTMNMDQVNSDLPKGVVASQSPAGGSSAPLGSAVTVFLSTGRAPKARVPNVVGFTEAEATQILRDAGYGVSVFYQAVSKVAYNDRVLGQNPLGGTNAQQGATVSIVVGQYQPNPSPTKTHPN